jgi:ATPase subunit of ABC transporter with duplicated ATPase domains
MSRSSQVLISADGLGYTLPDGRILFAGLSFGLGRERVGLVGRNGIGKSTLAGILAGQLEPATGRVVRAGRVAYLPQSRTERPPEPRSEARPAEPGSADVPGPPSSAAGTVAGAMGVGHRVAALDRLLAGGTDPADYRVVGDDWDLRERLTAELTRVGLGHLALDRPATAVSGGEATRLALAGRLLERPDVLILDEPTNDLDAGGRSALYRLVEEWTAGLLVITHDRALLERVDRILELSSLGARFYGGGWALYQAQREAEAAAAAQELAHARRALKQTERAVREARERQDRRTARAHRARHTANMPKILLGYRKDRGESTTGRLGDIGERRIAERHTRIQEARARVEEVDRLRLTLPSAGLHSTRLVAQLGDVAYTHPGAAAPVFEEVHLTLVGPERMAITGPNGAGKTTLLRILAGDLAPTHGTARLGIQRREVAYLDQRADGLDPDRSVLDNLRMANPDLQVGAARQALAGFLFRGDAVRAPVRDLSGGERIRAALACVLIARRPPKLLLLDEPTNHLDLDSLEAVEDAVAAYDGALVLVSHDERFLEAVGIEKELRASGSTFHAEVRG